MSMSEIANSFTSGFNRVKFQIQKKSPEILIVAGVIGVVAGAVMACVATTKVSKVLDDAKEKIDQIHEDEVVLEDGSKDEESQKELTRTYLHTGVELIKLYAPSIMIGALSLTSIIGSNHILKKRNIALAAAYATVDKTFKEYRDRVKTALGEESDKELRFGVTSQKVDKVVTDENGKEKKVKETIKVTDDINATSEYARFFDEACDGWDPDPEFSLSYLRIQQNLMNDKLKSQGHLFLNEVYDHLGYPRTRAGAVVGWVYDPERGTGDNYVDFGIYDVNRKEVRNFVNGYEQAILLDFNVDGVILSAL